MCLTRRRGWGSLPGLYRVLKITDGERRQGLTVVLDEKVCLMPTLLLKNGVLMGYF